MITYPPQQHTPATKNLTGNKIMDDRLPNAPGYLSILALSWDKSHVSMEHKFKMYRNKKHCTAPRLCYKYNNTSFHFSHFNNTCVHANNRNILHVFTSATATVHISTSATATFYISTSATATFYISTSMTATTRFHTSNYNNLLFHFADCKNTTIHFSDCKNMRSLTSAIQYFFLFNKIVICNFILATATIEQVPLQNTRTMHVLF